MQVYLHIKSNLLKKPMILKDYGLFCFIWLKSVYKSGLKEYYL